MPDTNEKLNNAATRHTANVARLQKQFFREVAKLLEEMDADLVDRIELQLNRIKTRGASALTLKSLRDLLRWVREQIREQTRIFGRSLSTNLSALGVYEGNWQAESLERAVPVVWNINTPSNSALRSIATSQPLGGKFLREWTAEWGAAKIRNVNQQIRLGLIEGQTGGQIARRVQNQVDISSRGARGIVRTTSNSVLSQAREMTYVENDDLIKGVEWVSTLDSRTTPICRGLDGRTFALDEGPRPPAHFNCRSTTAPVVKSFRELGLDLDEVPPAERPFVREQLSGRVPETTNFDSWLRSQDAGFQRDLLGPTRYRLFREGELTLNQFVSEQELRPLTLDEIRLRESEAWDRVFGQ